MKYNYCLVIIIVACVYASYINIQRFKAGVAKTEFARVINDYLNKAQNNDLVIAAKEKNLLAARNGTREIMRILGDNSKIDTIYDSLGNKKESRCFENDPRLICVVLRSTVSGQRHVLVYGKNGYVKELDESMFDRVMTASADEIANSAEIFIGQSKTEQAGTAETTPATTFPTSQIMSGESKTSIQNTPVEQINTEDAEKSEPTTASTAVKSPPAVTDLQIKEMNKVAANRQPKEKN